MKANTTFGGTYCAMITPFNQEGSLCEKTAREFVQFYMDKKINGIFTISNVGEFACLSLKEKKTLIDICCETGQGKIQVCPGVTSFCLDESLKIAQYAQKKGANAVILSAPIYYPYPKEYVEEFICTFLNRSPLPVLYYNSPKFANPISYDLLLKILDHPNVAAMKESSGDAMFLLRLLNDKTARQNSKPVLLGLEEFALTGLTYGAKGSMTSSGGIVPELMMEIVSAFNLGQYKWAARVQQEVVEISRVLAGYGFPQGYKMGMLARGFSFRLFQSPHMAELEGRYQQEIDKVKQAIQTGLALLERRDEYEV